MPASLNRKPIFIPIPLHEELKQRARKEGTTITGELLGLVREGKRMEQIAAQGQMAITN